MSDTPRSERQVAFIAAAIVLLALPLLVMFGLVVIALVTWDARESRGKLARLGALLRVDRRCRCRRPCIRAPVRASLDVRA